MSGKVGAIFRPPAEKLHLPRFTMDWAFPMNGRPDGLGVPDKWAFPSNAMAFPSEGHLMGVPVKWERPLNRNAQSIVKRGRCNLSAGGLKIAPTSHSSMPDF